MYSRIYTGGWTDFSNDRVVAESVHFACFIWSIKRHLENFCLPNRPLGACAHCFSLCNWAVNTTWHITVKSFFNQRLINGMILSTKSLINRLYLYDLIVYVFTCLVIMQALSPMNAWIFRPVFRAIPLIVIRVPPAAGPKRGLKLVIDGTWQENQNQKYK